VFSEINALNNVNHNHVGLTCDVHIVAGPCRSCRIRHIVARMHVL